MIQRTHRIFDHHTYAVYTSTENKMFIRAASGKRCFLDIGAAEGYYSAVFSAIAGENAEILSVDPMDPGWVGDGHLKSVRDQNSYFHRNRRWEIAKAYLTDHGNAIDSRAQVTSDCSVMTLAQLLGEYHFSPDFIKMDIESWEWEVLLSSLDLLNKLKPTILLEIHSSQLRDRGFSAVDLVERLRVGAGYRVTLQESRDFATAGNSHLVLDPIKK